MASAADRLWPSSIIWVPASVAFAPTGRPVPYPPQNTWLAVVGLLLIYTGFWGFYAACNVPIMDIDGSTERAFFSATTIYLTPTVLSAVTFNFLMSLAGGLLAGYFVSRGDPYWTFSGGLAGIITALGWERPLSSAAGPTHRGLRGLSRLLSSISGWSGDSRSMMR